MGRTSTRRGALVSGLIAMALSMAACGGTTGRGAEPRPVVPTPDATVAHDVAARQPLPDIVRPPENLPLPAPSGTLLLSTAGRGPQRVSLPPSFRSGQRLLVRVVCAGSPDFSLNASTDGSLLLRGGCDPGAVYSAQLVSGTRHAKVRLDVATDAPWRLAVWQQP